MKRIILLVLSLASGVWVLHEFNPANRLTRSDSNAEVAAADTRDAADEPRVASVVAIPEHVDVFPQAETIAADKSAVREVKYSVQVDDDSLKADVVIPEAAQPAPKSAPADGAALGRWASGVFRAIFARPATDATRPMERVAANSAAPSADAPKSDAGHVAASTNGDWSEKASTTSSTRSSVATSSTVDSKAAVAATPTSDTASHDCGDVKPNVATESTPTAINPAPAPASSAESHAAVEHPAVVAGAQDAAPSDAAATVASDSSRAAKVLSTTPASAAAIPPSGLATSPTAATAVKLQPTRASSAAAAGQANATPEAGSAAKTDAAADRPLAQPPLTPELEALSQKVQYAIAMYQHQRLLNTGTNVPWEVMHRFVAFGANTEVLKDGPGGQPVNAIGWLLWGGRCGTQPVLVLSNGEPYAMVGVGVQGHPGQFLAMLAQSRIRPDSPFKLDGRPFTVHDLVEQEKLDCDRSIELTFELIAMSYYQKTDDTWTARDGEEWSISRLVHEEIRQPIHNVAACGGSHRLFGLSAAFKKRMCEGKPVDGEFLQAQNYIHAYQRWTLGSLMNSDGSLSTEWFKRPADNGDIERKMQTTGHMLEWLLFSLNDNELRDPRVIRCVDYVATQLIMHPSRAWSVGPLGHALHALTLFQARVCMPQGPQFLQPTSPGSWAMRHSKSAHMLAHADPDSTLAPLPPVRSTAKLGMTAPEHAVLSSHPQQFSLPLEPTAPPVRTAARPKKQRVPHPEANVPSPTGVGLNTQGPDLGLTR